MNGQCKLCGELDIDDGHECKKTFALEISDSHPSRINTYKAYRSDVLALKLVGQRVEKRDLVNLVRWLILDKGATANKYLESMIETKNPQPNPHRKVIV